MVVLSVGMQKSGSGYMYNLLNDLLIISGSHDARYIKENYSLDNIMKWHNNNIGDLGYKKLIRLIMISVKSGSFVVKTHSGPSRSHDLLLKLRLIKTIYIYRDPRDVLLSVQDHGKKILNEGQNHTFAKMVNFEDAFNSIKKWIKVFESYNKRDDVLCISYEDLMNNGVEILKKICFYLNIDVTDEEIKTILNKYDKNNPKANMKGLHFNKGISNRYKYELSEEQLKRFEREMGIQIEKMGYSL